MSMKRIHHHCCLFFGHRKRYTSRNTRTSSVQPTRDPERFVEVSLPVVDAMLEKTSGQVCQSGRFSHVTGKYDLPIHLSWVGASGPTVEGYMWNFHNQVQHILTCQCRRSEPNVHCFLPVTRVPEWSDVRQDNSTTITIISSFISTLR